MAPGLLIPIGVVLAFAVAVGLSGLLSWAGPVDRPRERGMHSAPTPTSGGLAIIGGVCAAVLALRLDGSGAIGHAIAWALAIAVAHGLLGAVDDVVDLGARFKLGAQVLLALAFAALVMHPHSFVLTGTLAIGLPDWLTIPGTALWIVVVTNAINFMDGSNGLVAGSVAVVAAGLGAVCLLPGPTLTGFVLLFTGAACLGFLPFNFPRARLFQGDAGALFVGSLLAMLAVIGAGPFVGTGLLPLWTGPIALLAILTDVLLTLIARARRREPLLEAHRSHLFQRWLAARGGDHAALAWRFWAIMATFTGMAMGAALLGPLAASLIFPASLALAVGGWLWLDRGLRKAG